MKHINYLVVLMLGVVTLGQSPLNAETIISFWKSPVTPTYSPSVGWDSAAGFSGASRYAQVFTAPSSDIILKSFSFHAFGRSYANFRVNLYDWDSSTSQPTTLLNADPFEWYSVINHGDTTFAQFQTFNYSGFEYRLSPNQQYALVFMNYDSGMMNFAFNGDPSNSQGQAFVTADYRYSPYGDFGNNDALVQLTFVPEPSSLSLLVLGGLVVALRRRKR